MRLRRKVVWPVAVALAVVIAVATWFFTNFEEVPSTSRSEPTAATRAPFFALQLFLGKMGRPPLMATDPGVMDRLPATGVLVLGRGRRQFMTPMRVRTLMQWVKKGGHLIVPVGADGPDNNEPFLKALGVTWVEPDPKTGAPKRPDPVAEPSKDAEPKGAGSGGAEPKEAEPTNAAEAEVKRMKQALLNPVMLVRIPGARRQLTARGTGFFSVGLKTSAREPAWKASTVTGAQILHFPEGVGGITVVTFLSPLLGNDSLTAADNAEIAWDLLNYVSPTGPIIWMTNLHIPTLWEWFRGKAVTILAASLVLLLVWLWHEMPRFGGVRAEAGTERRALGAHLSSMGFAVWRNGSGLGLRFWLSEVRAYVLARAALREPMIRMASDAVLLERLSALTGLSEATVQRALVQITNDRSKAARNAFTHAIAVWQQIDQKL